MTPAAQERVHRYEATADKVAPRGHLQLVSQGNGSLVNWSQLMQRAQAGDSQAYTNLLISITPYVRALARRALAEAADVDEAAQDVLLTIHQIRHTYDPKRPFAPWLCNDRAAPDHRSFQGKCQVHRS